MTRREAESLINAIVTLRDTATDAMASKCASIYPTLKYTGNLIRTGTRIRWGEKLYIAAYDTYDRRNTDPDHDANGWTVLAFHDGYRDIPDAMYTSNMFMKGEIGWRGGSFWRSKIDNNSWTPEMYPAGWEVYTE